MQPKIYSTLFLCLIVATLVSTAPSASPVRKCVSGKSYYDGCNTCTCAGGVPACTLKICIVYDSDLNDYVPVPTLEAPEDFWEPIQTVEPSRA